MDEKEVNGKEVNGKEVNGNEVEGKEDESESFYSRTFKRREQPSTADDTPVSQAARNNLQLTHWVFDDLDVWQTG